MKTKMATIASDDDSNRARKDEESGREGVDVRLRHRHCRLGETDTSNRRCRNAKTAMSSRAGGVAAVIKCSILFSRSADAIRSQPTGSQAPRHQILCP